MCASGGGIGPKKPMVAPDDQARRDVAPWLARFRVSVPELVAETGIAWVWKVSLGATTAALKVYKSANMKDEAPGVRFLQDAGPRAVRILAAAEGAVLMEWLGGPTLGDVMRDGDVTAADTLLAETACGLGPVAVSDGYARPEVWMRALLRSDPGGAFGAQRAMAEALLADAVPLRVLHGDLHHDNVVKGTDGWQAIDAKGVIGELAYELANGFRNPVGAENVWREPGRVKLRAVRWGERLGVTPVRMMRWAEVHLALSILWDGGDDTHVDYPMLEVFRGVRTELKP